MNIDDIKTIGVLGGGLMGQGISMSALMGGYRVICRDLNDELIAKTRESMTTGRYGIYGAVERGKITKEQADQAVARLTLTTRPEDLKNVDFMLEAIGGVASGKMEDKNVKIKVFAEMDKIVKKEAIFASNTSFFTIADLAAVTNRKDRFIGMHFFSPANVMKGCEVIWTKDVLPEVIEITMELGRRWGKMPVKVKDIPGDTGFIGNRIYRALRLEANKIVEEGLATPEDIDIVMTTGFNWPVGPLGMGAGARGGWGKKK